MYRGLPHHRFPAQGVIPSRPAVSWRTVLLTLLLLLELLAIALMLLSARR